MQSSRIISYTIALLIAGGVLWYKFSMKGDVSKDCREQMLAQMQSLPDFASNEPLYTELLNRHHETAFARHYAVSGRRSSSNFDSEAYLDELFRSMADEAQQRSHAESADNLRELRTHITFDEESLSE